MDGRDAGVAFTRIPQMSFNVVARSTFGVDIERPDPPLPETLHACGISYPIHRYTKHCGISLVISRPN